MKKKPRPPDRTEKLRASCGGNARRRDLRITTIIRDNDSVPLLRIAGPWLEPFGFAPGSRLTITTEPGKLTLPLATPPRCS